MFCFGGSIPFEEAFDDGNWTKGGAPIKFMASSTKWTSLKFSLDASASTGGFFAFVGWLGLKGILVKTVFVGLGLTFCLGLYH